MGSVQTIDICPKCGIDGYIEDYDYKNDLWFTWCPNCNYGFKFTFHKLGWKIVNPITRFFNAIRRMFGKEERHFTWYDFTIIPRWLTGGRFAIGWFRYYIQSAGVAVSNFPRPAKFVKLPVCPITELFEEIEEISKESTS